MKKLLTIVFFVMVTLANYSANAQANVLDPADPDVIFTSSNHPAAPNVNVISKWGHTSRLGWNPYSYGYKSYIYKGMQFRLKFPKTYQHNVVDGKTYPVFVFHHGLGEPGSIYDNEYQLLHGGQVHAQNVDNGVFDGFLVFPQSTSGTLEGYANYIGELVDSLIKYVKADADRVIVSGLSAGGQATWEIMETQPNAKRYCAAVIISAAANPYVAYMPGYITIPIWVTNGGLDTGPAPGTVTYLIDTFKALGGKIQQTFFPTQGHGVWDSFWATPGYFQYLGLQHKSNPLVYFQRTAFCPNEPTNAKLGLQPGFFAYEWDKDGVVIPGANSSTLIATAYGTYRGHFKRTATSTWSAWSPIPVVITQKQGTVSPPIQINGLYSNVLPAPDGSTTVPLFVPDDYFGYEWRRVSDNALVSSADTLIAPIGQYKVKVTEQFGCSSNFSPIYSVVAANGPNGPDKATNLSALALTNTSVELDWNDNPSPINNETAFEIYRTTTPGTGYVLAGKTAADVVSFTDQGLSANTKYYYIVRAINDNAASPLSSEISVITKSDVVAPTAPTNLRVVTSSRSSVTLAWDEATDDVGVSKYEIYVNGTKSFVTSNATFTVPNLTALQTYGFFVKARDASGNLSPASNQVSGTAALAGLTYKYYEGTWTTLPDFNAITPVATGFTPNVSLTPALLTTNFGFLWEGFIKIPATGSYTFETNSDDGSRLYLGQYSYGATPLVNNDGAHGAQYKSGVITLTAGVYPIAITFFQATGGSSMNIYWTSTAAGINSRTAIPNSAFTDVVTIPASSLPAAPTFLNVLASSYNLINLSWTDNSNNETGFEVVRSTDIIGTYVPIGTTAANVTSFVDSVGLSPNTKYWYKIRAVNAMGQSLFVSNLEGSWSFDNNYNDGSGNNHILTPSGSPVFNAADKKEGTNSLSLDGNSQYADMTFSSGSAFPSNATTTRTVAAWIKPTAATVSGTNKLIFDFGGSDNGLGLRFNGNGLEAGIANSNTRSTAVQSSIATNASWVNGGWNHVAVVYNVNTLKLFVNGVEKASTNLSFSSVGSSASLSRIGATNTTNAFNSAATSTNFGGLIDNFVVLTEPLNANGIAGLMNQSYPADTTFALPAIPTAPDGLLLTALSPSSITVKWNDNSNNETGFEIYRSTGNSNNFHLLKTINANNGPVQLQYTDNNLFANTNYTYRIRAIGIGGNSVFTSDATIKTLNNAPVISDVTSFSMRYDSQNNISFSATDADVEVLTMTVLNLPSFGSFTPGNGTAVMQLNPSIADVGVYTVSVVVNDTNGGADTTTFTVTVNSDYVPVIAPVGNITVNEGTTNNFTLAATDQDAVDGALVWSLVSGTSFASITSNTDGTANLNLHPNYSAAGNYTLVAQVSDGDGGIATVSIPVTVVDVQPTTEITYMNMRYTSVGAAAPWNNISGTLTNNLLNSVGQVTATSLEFLGTTWNGGNAGAVTGNNSGVYPDDVIRDYFYFGAFGAPETVTFNIKGLVPSSAYTVTLFGSSAWTGLGNNGSTVYTINGVSKTLNIDNNQQNTVTFTGINPDGSGNIAVTMSKAPGAPYGAINAIVLQKPFNDGSTPILPINLAAQALSDGTVKLTWTDLAYNESNYLVYRSTNAGGPFTLLNPGATNANDVAYTDNTVSSNTTYYYKIEATNINGTSGQTGVVSVLTTNKPPVIAAISDVTVKGGSSVVVNFTATDPGDVLTASVSGLPSFGVYQSTGNGTGKLTFTPSVNDLGVYKNISITVTDNFGASSSTSFKLAVIDSSIRSVYVRFGPTGGIVQPAPWNNFLSFPYANTPLTNLVDDNKVNTGFSIKLLEQWTDNFNLGMITGDNSGIVPDNVMQSSIYTATTSTRTIQIDGLNPAKRYNVVFFSSHDAGPSSLVSFKGGSQTVTLDARYNTNTTVQVNGLTANASGSLQVNATKNSAATYLNLNAMIIEEYSATAPLLRPYYLFAESILDSSKIKLTWADRSANETGFQIWRATSPNGTYTLVTTTATNVTTYTNTGLSPNTRYYYKVRAANGASTFSNYSNIASMVLPAKIVYLNLTSNSAQTSPAPWNNTNSAAISGSTFPGLLDNTGLNSGVEMIITKDFNAPGFAGVNTAGIFPANVMTSNYWTDAGMTSEVKFDNLDLRKKYRIGCFGSAVNYGYFFANYTCNGKLVQLNSYTNSTKVVYLDNLTPNGDGELILQVNTTMGSSYSFTSAFTVEAFDDPTPYVAVPASGRSVNQVPQVTEPETPKVITQQGRNIVTNEETVLTGDVKVYPNPFTSKIDVEVSSVKDAVVTILMYDMNSRLIYRSDDINTTAGKNIIPVNLPGGRLTTGSYMLNVMLDGKMTKSVKLIKVN